MPQVLTLELPDDQMDALRRVARRANQPVEAWALASLRRAVAADDERAEALARLMRHRVSLGHPSGADDEQIDADLALKYGSSHDEDRP